MVTISLLISFFNLVFTSYSLGMKDSWGPLKALAAASVINGVGDIVLCTYLGYGIAGAAWATMASQVCGTNSSASSYIQLYLYMWFLPFANHSSGTIYCFIAPRLLLLI
jgi:O-antigen/teichoic acid export membrane protein